MNGEKGCLAHAGIIYSYQITIVVINVVNVIIANITKRHNIVSSLQSKNLILDYIPWQSNVFNSINKAQYVNAQISCVAF